MYLTDHPGQIMENYQYRNPTIKGCTSNDLRTGAFGGNDGHDACAVGANDSTLACGTVPQREKNPDHRLVWMEPIIQVSDPFYPDTFDPRCLRVVWCVSVRRITP